MASAAARTPAPAAAAPASSVLTGRTLMLAGIVLALTNFMVVLDTTIANVSVTHISGGLGVSTSQGTWVVTSYAVAEAVCVPLTGWLARRFGTVRTFVVALIGFGLFSMLCGLSPSLGVLVAARIGQGICGGPLMPLTQTLMLRIYPPEKRAGAMGLWAMTTVTAPIIGPILGGTISDDWSWPWIFFINLPICAGCVFGIWTLLRRVETGTEKVRVDAIGLAMMVFWIGCFQLMLDLGRERDWFGSPFIVALALLAVVGFVVFMIWELTEDEPIVDLSVFRHRGFSASVAALAFSFGTYFASIVIIPQWLQGAMGYTATEAGRVTAFNGVLAVIMSPVAARMMGKVDPRLMVFGGILWLAFCSALRGLTWSTGSDFWTLAWPQLLQGAGMPFFFIPLTTLALGSVTPRETASAAGVMSFLRTLAGAIGTSVATTAWDDQSRADRVALVSVLNGQDAVASNLQGAGFGAAQAQGVIAQMVDMQATVIATDRVFLAASGVFLLSAGLIWLVPKPPKKVDTSAAH